MTKAYITGDIGTFESLYYYFKGFNMTRSECEKLLETFAKKIFVNINDINAFDVLTTNRDAFKSNLLKIPIVTDKIFTVYNKINNIFIDDYLYHIDSGGYGTVFRCNDYYCMKFIMTNKETLNMEHEYYIPYNLNILLTKYDVNRYINVPLTLLKKFDCSAFKWYFLIHALILIMIKYAIDDDYSFDFLDMELYEYNNIANIYYSLFYNKNFNQIVSFYNYFTYLLKVNFKREYNNIILINKFDRFIHLLRQVQGHKLIQSDPIGATVIILPLAISSAPDLLLNNDKYPDMKNGNNAISIEPYYVRHMILQILFTIFVANTNNKFNHNDLKPNNILVFITKPHIIKYNDYTLKFNEPYLFKLSDFDFSIFNKIENNRIKGTIVSKISSISNDIIYFFIFIKRFFPSLSEADPTLYKYITSTLSKVPKKDIKYEIYYTGTELFNIEFLENFIFNSGLFSKWIHKN